MVGRGPLWGCRPVPPPLHHRCHTMRPTCIISPKNTSEGCTCSPSSPMMRDPTRSSPSPTPRQQHRHFTATRVTHCPAGPSSLRTRVPSLTTAPRSRVHGPWRKDTPDPKIPSSFTREAQPVTLVHKSHLFLLAPVKVGGRNQAGTSGGARVQEW